MAAQSFRVEFARGAMLDLHEISTYWAEHEDPERGEQYMRDLHAEAQSQLSDVVTARGGRHLRERRHSNVQEIYVFKRSYRILYERDESSGLVIVLRFWHSHRDEPFQD
jgi:plasmid stabilization system protein ParE